MSLPHGNRAAFSPCVAVIRQAFLALPQPEQTRCLLALPERWALVITMRFGTENGFVRTLGAVALILHISGDRVRQLEQKAAASLLAAMLNLPGDHARTSTNSGGVLLAAPPR